MVHKKNGQKEPWRVIVGIISILFIVFMWIGKDILHIYSTMTVEDALPLIVTTVAVTVLKVLLIAAVIFLGKWIISKFIKNK